MGNFNIKIELDRIPGAKIMDIKGDVATRRCIVIPIDNERGTVIDEYKKFDPGLGAMTSRPLEHVQLLATAYELRLKSLHQAAGISGIFREDERDTGPRPSVHRIAPALEDRSEEGRGKRRGQLVGHDLGWY